MGRLKKDREIELLEARKYVLRQRKPTERQTERLTERQRDGKTNR